ncbi:DNA polymerase III subunit alpha [Yinghuangia soli]|uniref:DNA polymerase III subunit alpha n=1 Tax=Yinghuangia soli TaxID=2908204 RepID=A0AA41U4X8_9ACTN|nr:DNA polymerase III subunit alpha [Yinghuangia soli]MCF2531287.1 DNA polymerase III subunit alpha [Yinghuangia soli]
MTPPFTHLHVASGYSMRYGVSHPHTLVARAADEGMDALALTDRDGVYGAVAFVKACTKAGIRPILGADLAVADPDPHRTPVPTSTGTGPARSATRAARPGLGAGPGSAAAPGSTPARARAAPAAKSRKTPARGGAYVDPRHPRATVLARGRTGWAALCRLVSDAHRRGRAVQEQTAGPRPVPACTRDALAEHASRGDLVVLLGPDSEVGRALAARRPELAARLLAAYRDALPPGALYVELVSHRGPSEDLSHTPGASLSTSLAARMLVLADDHGVPAVLTNAVRYADRADAPVADVLDAARRLVPLGHRHLDRVGNEGYLKSHLEMVQLAAEIVLAADRGTARGLLARTRDLAESLVLDPREDLGIGKVFYPEPEVIGVPSSAAAAELRRRCEAGLGLRGIAPTGRARKRLDDELALIGRLGLPSYFLTVAGVVDLIREMGIRCAARGSGAGSLVNHLLGISGVDPLRYGLIMERFVSDRRSALPDIDVDVESARRTDVYERIMEKFGAERCAMVSMTETYRARHAIRDVGAALGLPPGEIDAVAKAFPHIRARDVRAALRDLPELRASGITEAGFGTLLTLAERLDGLPRHLALHPCGVLLSDTTLLDRTPVETSAQEFPMSQFGKDDVEDLGLLKLDVLGVRMQSAMAHALDEVARTGGGRIDLDAVPFDDPATFELIRSTRTLGCFQIESPGQRELVGKFAPETFEDLIVDISLFRPGPVKSDMVTPFLNARQGWAEPDVIHRDLWPALAETEGVVVFHEQVIRMIATMTGCDFARADVARRALGTVDGQTAIRDWFVAEADRRGYARPVVERVWEVLKAFASFGFCKAHAAAFAVPTYQSAWLKAHHTAAFAAGVLTHDPGMYPKRLILDDARQFGIPVLGVDVNVSDPVYRVERTADGRDGIRIALAEVKGISETEVERIVEARPYTSLADFWHRAGVSRPVVERLILVGAFDTVHAIPPLPDAPRPDTLPQDAPPEDAGLTRRDLLLQLTDLDRYGREAAPAKGRRAAGLSTQLAFGLAGSEIPEPAGLPEMTAAERVRAELEILGMDADRHVVGFYEDFLAAVGVTRSRDLLTRRARSELLVAGVKVATQTPPVRSGRRVVFLTLDDATGPIDATFFEDAQGPYAATLFHSWLLVVRGVLRRTGPRGVSLRATGCWEMGTLYEAWREGGTDAVHALMAGAAPGHTEQAVEGAAASRSTRPVMHRVLVHPSGFRVSPYADLRPPGTPAKDAPRKLWHTSPGSAG